MQRFFAVLVLVIGVVSSSWAGVSIPAGYTKVESKGSGFSIYKKGNLYVTVVDLQKYEVTFGGVHKASSGNSFYKHKLNDWWNYYRPLAMFNGQFFNTYKDPTPLSFPLRAQYQTLVRHTDPGRSLKTLKIYSNGNEAQVYYGYDSWMLNNSKELIVGLNPSENMDENSNIGRFYIGGLHSNSSSLRYLLFFVSERKSQGDMLSEIHDWGVWDQDIVMMDGSGSAQMKTNKVTIYGYNQYYFRDKRDIPNVILVRDNF